MEVGPPSNNHYLSIAWIAQVRCQLPLSGPVPAHVEEDLDDDKYYNHSEKEKQEGEISPTRWLKHHCMSMSVKGQKIYSHVPVKLHYCQITGWMFS